MKASEAAAAAHSRVAQNFLNYVTGADVENVGPSPAATPLAHSTASSSTPVRYSNPMRGAIVAQEMIPADDLFMWPRTPGPLLRVTDKDGDSIRVDHVFVGDERGAQVWLTAVGEDGQRVQVALDATALSALGERLLDEAEDAL